MCAGKARWGHQGVGENIPQGGGRATRSAGAASCCGRWCGALLSFVPSSHRGIALVQTNSAGAHCWSWSAGNIKPNKYTYLTLTYHWCSPIFLNISFGWCLCRYSSSSLASTQSCTTARPLLSSQDSPLIRRHSCSPSLCPVWTLSAQLLVSYGSRNFFKWIHNLHFFNKKITWQ